MDIKLILDSISVGFEILIAYLFFRVFLTKCRFAKIWVIGVFTLIFLGKLGGSYYLPEAWMKTVWSLGCYFVLTCCFQGKITKKLTITGFLGLITILPEYIVHGLLMLFVGAVYVVDTYNIHNYALGMFLSKFVAILLCLFLYYWKRRKQENMLKDLSYHWYFLFLIYPAITLFILVQNYYLILNDEQMIYVKWFVLSSVLLVLSNVIIFQILDEMQRLQAMRLKAELAERQLMAQEKHYAELIEKNTSIKKYIHDTKNLLLILQGYVTQGKMNEASEYLQEILNNLNSESIDYTGNIVLDTVLSTKMNEARNAGIELVPAIALYGQLNIKVIDLALLLGNALDNAIEATAKISDIKRKKIYLTVKLHQDILHIVLKNPVDTPVIIEDGNIVTSKENAEMHGLGITNMKTIVQKYNGTFDIRCSGDIFVLNAVIENE